MAKNDFLPFATADGANVLSADEYQKLTARSNGFSAGVARSQQLNTVWRQASVIAHVVAQFIADTNNSDVADDGNLAALQSELVSALSKTVTSTVPAASLTTAGITQLSSATDSDDETMAATPKAVKAAYDLAHKVSVDGLYPVGIVVWFAQNKDPNTLFPGTSWKYIGEDKTVRLASADGKDVMTTGGSDSVTLTVDNLPAHSHEFKANTNPYNHGSIRTSTDGSHSHSISYREHVYNGGGYTTTAVSGTTLPLTKRTSEEGSHAHYVAIGAHAHAVSGTTANTGTGSVVSITNAFIKLMGWYRSA